MRAVPAFAMLAAALLLVGCCKTHVASTAITATVDRSDPAATARAVLTAYRDKDLEALSRLCTRWNSGLMAEMAKSGEGHPSYASIFGGWRWKAVSAWDGRLRETRFRGPDAAAVAFGDIEPDEIAVVSLEWEGGRWCFDDVNSPATSRFKSLPTERPGRASPP